MIEIIYDKFHVVMHMCILRRDIVKYIPIIYSASMHARVHALHAFDIIPLTSIQLFQL